MSISRMATRLEKLESKHVVERVFIVGGDVADCERKLERLIRQGELRGREPALISTGIFRSTDSDEMQPQ